MPYAGGCASAAAAVDYGEAHCLVCDVAAVRAVGGFDDELADFGDIDLGRRVRRAGYEVWFEPRAVVYFQQSAPIELEDVDVFAWRLAPRTVTPVLFAIRRLVGRRHHRGGPLSTRWRRATTSGSARFRDSCRSRGL